MDTDKKNALTSRREIAMIKKDLPSNLFVYVNLDKGIVTTWVGDKIGDIIFVGREFKSNMGDLRVPIVVNIFNKKYKGIFFKSAGDYARIKKVI